MREKEDVKCTDAKLVVILQTKDDFYSKPDLKHNRGLVRGIVSQNANSHDGGIFCL